MKISTIVKAVVAVTTVCAVGAVAYKKIKENENEKTEAQVVPKEDEEADPEPVELTSKEKAVITVVSVVGGLAAGFVTLMYVPVFMYKSSVHTLAERAIQNGNLTFEKLVELSKPVTEVVEQEVV